MRVLLQRVGRARVTTEGELLGEIGPGLLALVGFGAADGPGLPETRTWRAMLDKIAGLRIFPDAEGRLNLSLTDTGGDLLAVSQFTLYADCRKGRRPSFTAATAPDTAHHLFHRFCSDMAPLVPGRLATGEFGAMMDVELVNQGPVTILLDSEDFGG